MWHLNVVNQKCSYFHKNQCINSIQYVWTQSSIILQINSIDINKQIYKHGYNSNIQGISKQSLSLLTYHISLFSNSLCHQYRYFLVFRPFYFISCYGVHLYNVIRDSIVVEHGSNFTTKGTSNKLEQR